MTRDGNALVRWMSFLDLVERECAGHARELPPCFREEALALGDRARRQLRDIGEAFAGPVPGDPDQ